MRSGRRRRRSMSEKEKGENGAHQWNPLPWTCSPRPPRDGPDAWDSLRPPRTPRVPAAGRWEAGDSENCTASRPCPGHSADCDTRGARCPRVPSCYGSRHPSPAGRRSPRSGWRGPRLSPSSSCCSWSERGHPTTAWWSLGSTAMGRCLV